MTSSVRLPAVFGRRACAGLAALSAGLHALMIGHAGNPVTAGVMVAMLVACLYCARDLWTGGSVRAWLVVALMNLGMIAVHWSAPGCHPGAAVSAALTPPSALMTTATAVALTEAVIATAVLYGLSRAAATRMALR